MTECVAWMGEWDTTKTRTFEMAIGTRFGMMSIRLVEAANGKKTEVFTGFDPIWDESVGQHCVWNGTGIPVPEDTHFWEHRYIASIEKAAKKWGGQHEQLAPCELALVLDHVSGSYEQIVLDHIGTDEKASGHWDMLRGVIPGVASATKTSNKDPRIVAAAQELKARREAATQSDFERRVAEDELYGIF